MTSLDVAGRPPRLHAHVLPYMALAMMAGTTAGMLRALSPILAIHLGVSNAQIGIVSGVEMLGMAVMTLPAGVLVSRYGPRLIYVLASFTITAVYCFVPWSRSWIVLAIGLAIGGSCMPYRIVALNSSFLERLKELGQAKAGWYSSASTTGMLLVGPALATFLLTHSGIAAGYLGVSFLFACMGVGGTFILAKHSTRGSLPISFTSSLAQSLRLLRDPVVSAICTIEASTSIVFSFFSSFIVVTAIKLVGLSEPAAISIRLFEGLIAVVTMFIGGALVRDRPLIWFYRSSLLLIVSGFCMLSIARNYVSLVSATLLLGMGMGITSLIQIIRVGATELPKSRVSSLQLFSWMGGGFAGALLAGLLSKYLGLQGMFLCGAFLYVLLASRWCFAAPRTA